MYFQNDNDLHWFTHISNLEYISELYGLPYVSDKKIKKGLNKWAHIRYFEYRYDLDDKKTNWNAYH